MTGTGGDGPSARLDRRSFLSVSAAAAAAGVLTSGLAQGEQGVEQPAPARGRAERGVVRKALKYGMIGDGATVAEKLAIARDAGFEGVEFDAPGGPPVDEILAAKEKTGIEVPGVVDSVHWKSTLGDPGDAVRLAGRHALEKALVTCRDLGGTQVLLVPAVVNERISYRQAYDLSVHEIRRVVPLARELGVGIAFENVWNNFLLSPLEAMGYINAVATPSENSFRQTSEGPRPLVGWYLDIGNIWYQGWPAHWLEALTPRFVTRLDIKGFSRAKADKEGKWAGFGVEIGDGDVPWSSVREWLGSSGWSGWATAEVRGGDRARLSEISRRMDTVLGIGR